MAQATVAGKGLEGVTATTSAVSSIIGSTLTYRGIDINELAEHSSFEETTWLLWYGELPTRQQLQQFRAELAKNRTIPQEVIELIRRFPGDAQPMVSLIASISSLAFYDGDARSMSEEANHRKGVRLVASFPTVVAAIQRLRSGQEPVAPDPELSAAANFLYMLDGQRPSESSERVMDIALVLHADHELNASTFAARIAASTLADMHSCLVAALCTLKGPLHGGANQDVIHWLLELGDEAAAADRVKNTLARKVKIPG